MRDLLLTVFLFGSVPFILRWPVLGVYLWIWVSMANPHRYTWGFAYNYPFAQAIAIATLMGMLFYRGPKRLPVTGVTVVLFILAAWMGITTWSAINVDESLVMWERVMKILLMVFVAIYLLHSKKHIQLLILIVVGCVAFFSIKGGLFTLREGGEARVFGPPGGFIEENNALALATIMTIPLLYFLYLQATKRWMRWGLIAAMALSVFSALGSYSRGGLLGIAVMVAFLWWRSRSRLVSGLVLAMLIPVAIGFMPEQWGERMRTIQSYEEDTSAMGRINAWMMAFNLANDRPVVGGGFEIYDKGVFGRYAPDPEDVHAAHSIYFQMLGEHGYVGLALFLLLWMLVWRDASWIIKHCRSRTELRWARDLALMIQVSLVGYAVGGAFLSLAYFEVPYYFLAAVVLTRVLVEKEIKTEELRESVPAAQGTSVSGEAEALARAGLRADGPDVRR
jgi:putative inorganic carbon (HCO3(-)) transporter